MSYDKDTIYFSAFMAYLLIIFACSVTALCLCCRACKRKMERVKINLAKRKEPVEEFHECTAVFSDEPGHYTKDSIDPQPLICKCNFDCDGCGSSELL